MPGIKPVFQRWINRGAAKAAEKRGGLFFRKRGSRVPAGLLYFPLRVSARSRGLEVPLRNLGMMRPGFRDRA